LAASRSKPIPSTCLAPALRAGPRALEWGRDLLARLTRKRRSTLARGYAIKDLVFRAPAAAAPP
jgi:hypothetical protein